MQDEEDIGHEIDDEAEGEDEEYDDDDDDDDDDDGGGGGRGTDIDSITNTTSSNLIEESRPLPLSHRTSNFSIGSFSASLKSLVNG